MNANAINPPCARRVIARPRIHGVRVKNRLDMLLALTIALAVIGLAGTFTALWIGAAAIRRAAPRVVRQVALVNSAWFGWPLFFAWAIIGAVNMVNGHLVMAVMSFVIAIMMLAFFGWQPREHRW